MNDRLNNSRLKNSRWYDYIPSLAQAMGKWEKVSVADQIIVSDCLLDAMKGHPLWTQHFQGVRQMGAEKLSGLYLSKQRRRWYDQELSTHYAVILLYVAPEALQTEMGVRLLLAFWLLEQIAEDPFSPAAKNKVLWIDKIFRKPIPQLVKQLTIMAPIKAAQVEQTDDGGYMLRAPGFERKSVTEDPDWLLEETHKLSS